MCCLRYGEQKGACSMWKKEIVECHVTLRPLMHEMIHEYIAQFSTIIQHSLQVDSAVSEELYLREQLNNQETEATLFFCIFDNAKDMLIGGIAIRDPSIYRGQLYCWLHESYWGKGYFKEALHAATHAYFKATEIRSINAYVDVVNKRSYYALKKNGFSDIGISRGPFGKQYELILRRK